MLVLSYDRSQPCSVKNDFLFLPWCLGFHEPWPCQRDRGALQGWKRKNWPGLSMLHDFYGGLWRCRCSSRSFQPTSDFRHERYENSKLDQICAPLQQFPREHFQKTLQTANRPSHTKPRRFRIGFWAIDITQAGLHWYWSIRGEPKRWQNYSEN